MRTVATGLTGRKETSMVNEYKEMFKSLRKELLIKLIREVDDDKTLSRVYKILLKASKEQ